MRLQSFSALLTRILQLLHGHWHYHPNRQLPHRRRGIREDPQATDDPAAPVPVSTSSCSRGQELEEDLNAQPHHLHCTTPLNSIYGYACTNKKAMEEHCACWQLMYYQLGLRDKMVKNTKNTTSPLVIVLLKWCGSWVLRSYAFNNESSEYWAEMLSSSRVFASSLLSPS
jgi:hypothetical protein